MKSNQDPNQKRSQNGHTAAEDAILHELILQPGMLCVSTNHRRAGEVACTVINPQGLQHRKVTPRLLEQHCLIETPGRGREDYLANPDARRSILRKLVPLVVGALAVCPA